jgi:hypothetical protein
VRLGALLAQMPGCRTLQAHRRRLTTVELDRTIGRDFRRPQLLREHDRADCSAAEVHHHLRWDRCEQIVVRLVGEALIALPNEPVVLLAFEILTHVMPSTQQRS